MNSEFSDNGFAIIKNVFTEEEVNFFREVSLEYFAQGGGFADSTGRAKPDWIKEQKLSSLYEKWQSKNIEGIIENLIGEKVEFVGHNDLHLNRNAGWHKDRLNNEARKFELNSPWETVDGETMKIYKVNFYMQSHINNHDGLTVVRGSHKTENMAISGQLLQLCPAIGDITVFDQRITHMGRWSGGYDRLLLCMGYGVNNIFFDQFKQGTEFRQNKQNSTRK